MRGITDSIESVKRILDGISLRHRVIAGNIANQNTPGYLRRVVTFERVLDAKRSSDRTKATRPVVEVDASGTHGSNGNNVELEAELRDLEKNRLLYELFTRALGGKFKSLQTAIKGHL